jgi:hypothetical protein
MTDIFRTADDRFANLPDFPYEPRCVDDLPGYGGLRMNYIDEGPADAGHFCQERGESVARKYLDLYGD